MLSLISISLIVVSGDDEVKNDEEVYEDEKEENYDEKTDDKVVEETVTDNAVDDPKDDSEQPAVEPAVEENEDTVDVENVAIGKQKGKYMNYDDYFLSSAIDGSDTSYNWNGESFCNCNL